MAVNVLRVIVVAWMGLVIHAAEMCFPGGQQIFPWVYEPDVTRIDTSWYWNDIKIMVKRSDDTIAINPATHLSNRIWEYNETNCGLIVNDVSINDTGLFRVEVQLSGVPKFIDQENLDVSSNYANSEVYENAQIFINNTLYNVPDNNSLGNAPLSFTFDLTKACIPAPDISITYGNDKTTCPGELTCSKDFDMETNFSLTIVIEHSITITYPAGGGYFSVEASKTSQRDPAEGLPCRKRVECIVPATVVPIGCAIIVVTTVLAVKKPFSE